MADVRLTVGGMVYGGWKSVTVTRDMQAVAGRFRLSLSERWAGQGQAWPIMRGDQCTVTENGALLISGYVDTVSPSFGPEERSITVTGRDVTEDLVDCSAIHNPDQWTGIGFMSLVNILCGPFGIGAKLMPEAGAPDPFRVFKINRGESAWEAIERACRMRGLVALSDGAGGVEITRTGKQKSGTKLEQGVNIIQASATLTTADRYSQYICQGQQPGNDFIFGAAAAAVEGIASDPDVKRFRPLLVNVEAATSIKDAKLRAQWEASTRAGKATEASVTVRGWREKGSAGALWAINKQVLCAIPYLQLQGWMLISGVEFSLDEEGGTITILKLKSPDAFTPEPIPAVASTDKSSVWRQAVINAST